MKTFWRLLYLCLCVTLVPAPTGAQAPASPGDAAVRGGGFQPGDRILLRVEGDSIFTGTFPVGPGPVLTLPEIGAIPLAGVRRSEVEAYLGQQLRRYLKDPVVHAKALVHVSIVGEVEHPGFYSVPADAALGDALMQAGGPTRDAKVAALRVERGGKSALEGDSLQLAFARGLTLDQVGLRDGDRFVVPKVLPRDPESKWRILGILVTIPVAIYGMTRVF
jgi:protein involved in polysaccharide export with SLBB domain